MPNPLALTILAGLIITAAAIAFDAYRNPVEDDPDQITDDEEVIMLGSMWEVRDAGQGRDLSFDHDRNERN
jgi:hypothetical protein